MDLLFGDEPSAYSVGVVSRYFYTVGFAALGFAGACFHNVGKFRPLMSGIHKHFIGVAAGAAAGECMPAYKKWRFGRRDAILKNYIELHPELFEEKPKQKYKDILEDWYPVR